MRFNSRQQFYVWTQFSLQGGNLRDASRMIALLGHVQGTEPMTRPVIDHAFSDVSSFFIFREVEPSLMIGLPMTSWWLNRGLELRQVCALALFSSRLPIVSKKISSGRVKKYLGQRQVSLLFTAGQKYAWIRSGPISMLKGHTHLMGFQNSVHKTLRAQKEWNHSVWKKFSFFNL